jgi:hypothetical protein
MGIYPQPQSSLADQKRSLRKSHLQNDLFLPVLLRAPTGKVTSHNMRLPPLPVAQTKTFIKFDGNGGKR